MKVKDYFGINLNLIMKTQKTKIQQLATKTRSNKQQIGRMTLNNEQHTHLEHRVDHKYFLV